MSERDEFERFVTDKFFDIEKDHIGYTSWVTQFAWKVWQDTRIAARAPQVLTDEQIDARWLSLDLSDISAPLSIAGQAEVRRRFARVLLAESDCEGKK